MAKMTESQARKRHFMRESCFKKRRFDTREKAEDDLWRIAREMDVLEMRVYYCRICGGWHMGHSDKRARGNAV